MNIDRLSVARSNPLAVVSTIIRKQMRDRAPITSHPSPPLIPTKPNARRASNEPVLNGRLLSIRDVCRKVAMGKSTVYRWIAEGRFPHGIELAPQLVRWSESEIDVWIAACGARRSIPAAIEKLAGRRQILE